MNPSPTSTLPPPPPPDARIDLPNLSCEPLLGPAEAAVLFAAGYADAARDCLEQWLARQPEDARAWIMLFDLHRTREDRAAFDALAEGHARLRPGLALPPWTYEESAVVAEMIRLSGAVSDASIAKEILAQSRTRRVVAIDLGKVTRIDYAVAPALCGALRLLAMQSKRVILANVAELHLQLLALVGLPAAVAVISPRAITGSATSTTEHGSVLKAA
jgi:ABC-type transporter Mla MlaB component